MPAGCNRPEFLERTPLRNGKVRIGARPGAIRGFLAVVSFAVGLIELLPVLNEHGLFHSCPTSVEWDGAIGQAHSIVAAGPWRPPEQEDKPRGPDLLMSGGDSYARVEVKTPAN